MRRDVPVVSKRIFEASGTVAVELVFDPAQGLGAAFDRALEDGVGILDVDMKGYGSAAHRLGADRVHLGMLVGEHDHGVAEIELRMTDLAAGSSHAHPLSCA